jgi:pimeloyl-ACP methyl ester carboxylesterase
MDINTVSKLPLEVWSMAPLMRRFAFSVAEHFTLLPYPEPTADHPVLLIPGLGATPHSMYWLKHELMAKGYRVYSSNIARNLGSFEQQGLALSDRVHEINDKTGALVDIIGWSMGGRYAVRLTKSDAMNIGKIITLGSPLKSVTLTAAMEQAWKNILFFANIPTEPVRREMEYDGDLLGSQNPLSAIIGHFDAVVSESCAVIPEHHLKQSSCRENIYVDKGHLALGFSTIVRDIIIDRLEQRIDSWLPYSVVLH